MVKIDVSEEFRRRIKPLYKKYRSLTDDYSNLIAQLEANPYAGIDLGGGMHKVRMAIMSKGKGKSGGARVITYVVEEVDDDIVINLLTIYDKNEISSVSEQYLKSLIQQLSK